MAAEPRKRGKEQEPAEGEAAAHHGASKAQPAKPIEGGSTAQTGGTRGLLLRAFLGMLLAVLVGFRSEKILSAIPQLFDTSGPSPQSSESPVRESSAEPKLEQFDVEFVNEWSEAVSLYWEASEDDWTMVVNSVKGRVKMSTFEGHQFMFTREGTRDAVGDTVVIEKGKHEYVLQASAKRRSEVEDPCSDRFPKRCKQYAKEGECESNPGWMIVNCPAACNACDLLDYKARCDRARLNITEEPIWQPGDLNKRFEYILENFAELKPEVVSRPPDGPWIIVFDNFLTNEEVDRLLYWGKELGYERSSDVGNANERGETTKIISQSRTSSNTWCTRACEEDPIIVGVTERTERVTGVPTVNYESIQLLEYTNGQYYRAHHDMSPRAKFETAGPRILTFFLYLSDVEEGGETEFPLVQSGLKVKPKKGRAVLWPSVLDEAPLNQDPRTRHAALPVRSGVKYGANHWIHSHDFRKANLWGCTGSFS
mmetsp:Transcript_17705/g.56550  ORF Transcript_17705/g.56550 Transcript_17705/m.56550 type:complete len:482 (-) Transcript_17705:344-1789(-)